MRPRFLGSKSEKESPSDLTSPLTALLERCGTEAMEIGWARLSAAEQQERMEAVIRSARAELVLLEQERRGPPGPDAGTLATALQELLHRRALIAPHPPKSGGEEKQPAPWHFDWRRAAVSVTLAVVTALLGSTFGTWSLGKTLTISLLGALLLALGKVSDVLRNCAAIGSDADAWLRARWRMYVLDRRIDKTEDEIIEARIRRREAEEWVEDRLALVRERCEVQRARAELAAHTVGGWGRLEPSDEERALAARRGN